MTEQANGVARPTQRQSDSVLAWIENFRQVLERRSPPASLGQVTHEIEPTATLHMAHMHVVNEDPVVIDCCIHHPVACGCDMQPPIPE